MVPLMSGLPLPKKKQQESHMIPILSGLKRLVLIKSQPSTLQTREGYVPPSKISLSWLSGPCRQSQQALEKWRLQNHSLVLGQPRLHNKLEGQPGTHKTLSQQQSLSFKYKNQMTHYAE